MTTYKKQQQFKGFKPNLHWYTYPDTILEKEKRYIPLTDPILDWKGKLPERTLYDRVRQRSQAWYLHYILY